MSPLTSAKVPPSRLPPITMRAMSASVRGSETLNRAVPGAGS
ncbi:Uncharacterised protein [Mycobacteroides abscessus subsp. abscessus]|nr:Uncharacterised protein [Mycobacteroides abscessus subsp. abscessus]